MTTRPGQHPGVATTAPSWTDVGAMQLELLRAQLDWVARRSPFYARRFAAAGFRPDSIVRSEDLQQLPFTTKPELHANQASHPPMGDFACVSIREVSRVYSSTGTLGHPTRVGLTVSDRTGWTTVANRVLQIVGMRSEDVVVTGMAYGQFTGGLPISEAIDSIGAAQIPGGTGSPASIIGAIRDFQASFLICSPSFAFYLAEYAEEKMELNPAKIGVRRILLGAEGGADLKGVRDAVATRFDAATTSAFGSADLMPIYAGACEQDRGEHLLAPDHLYLELVDPQTGEPMPWEDGAEGELVGTHLRRECTPLVRFRTRDIVRINAQPCPCGRPGPRITCVGRTDDVFHVDGRAIYAAELRAVVASQLGRTTGMVEVVVLDRPAPGRERVSVRVEYGMYVEDLGELRRDLGTTIEQHFGVSLHIDLLPPGSLPRYDRKAVLIRRIP